MGPSARRRPPGRVEDDTGAGADEQPRTALVESLRRARFEIVPMKGVDDQLEHLPSGATVTITSSPTKGIEATLELAERLRPGGFRLVPHLAARLVTGRGHLREILDGVEALGITDVFVVAGDAHHPVGPYEGAAALLREMGGMDHGLTEIGITGYPEGHPFISDAETVAAMAAKAPYATYIVSQICYDPATIVRWVGAVRDRGVHLPIHIGLPGVVDRARLLRISTKVGLGDSLRFLRRQSGVVTKVLGGYTPDHLVEGLTDLVGDERADVRGWHLFTFNEVQKTEHWRQETMTRFGGRTSG